MAGWQNGLAFLLLLGCSAPSYGQPLERIEAMIKWVVDLGGTVHAEVKYNKDGVRGLFTTKAVKEGENIAEVPSSAILNAGGLNDSFAVSTLTVLREVKDPHSRFKPYVDMWPDHKGVLNSCNMDAKYAKMWKNEYWERQMTDWQRYLGALLDGSLNPDLEYTIQEMVGNATVTMEDLQYACAIASTRYVSAARRRRLIMAPVFDLANHERLCDTEINSYDDGDVFQVIAGRDMEAGEEVCYSYGQLHDDYAAAHYGFLPRLEDPPRLALVDHRDWREDREFSHDDPLSEEPSTGSPEEMRVELARVTDIYTRLRATPDPLPPQPKGQDYTYDLLKGLEERRLNALQYEIRRLSGLLNERAEL